MGGNNPTEAPVCVRAILKESLPFKTNFFFFPSIAQRSNSSNPPTHAQQVEQFFLSGYDPIKLT